MGTFSHKGRSLSELPPPPHILARPPANGGRRICGRLRWDTYSNEWTICRGAANSWAPEINACVHHMPPAWQDVCNRRAELYASIIVGLWDDVLHDVPPPPGDWEEFNV